MNINLISVVDLIKRDKWSADYFTTSHAFNSSSAFPFVPIGDLVTERKESIEPQKYPTHLFNYLGLEYVAPLTGALTGFIPKQGSEVKSRSKIFRTGDILFGRLRPELNKVYLVGSELNEGISSTEFIVMKPKLETVRAKYLRYVLASSFVQEKIKGLTTGAALPRIQSDDLFNILIPIPPMEYQLLIEKFIDVNFTQWDIAKKIADKLPTIFSEKFVECLESGKEPMSINIDDFKVEEQFPNSLPFEFKKSQYSLL